MEIDHFSTKETLIVLDIPPSMCRSKTDISAHKYAKEVTTLGVTTVGEEEDNRLSVCIEQAHFHGD